MVGSMHGSYQGEWGQSWYHQRTAGKRVSDGWKSQYLDPKYMMMQANIFFFPAVGPPIIDPCIPMTNMKLNSFIAERFSSRGSALTTAGRKHVAGLSKALP